MVDNYIDQSQLDDLLYELGKREKGVHNWKNDRGGPTAHGITEKVARKYGFHDVNDVTPEDARDIFKKEYYVSSNIFMIPDLRLQWRLLLDGLHSGNHRVNKRLQKLLNAHNRNEKDYPDIKADGKIGPITINTIHLYMDVFIKKYKSYQYNDEHQIEELFWFHLCEEMRALQFAWYVDIINRLEKQEEFFNGWKNRIAFEPSFYKFNYDTSNPNNHPNNSDIIPS